MISLTIDGKSVQAEPGSTVLRAAQRSGIHIPTLCDHPHLTPYGGCRLCMVEVKGMRVPAASCTLPVTEGMIVQTNTPALQQSRQVILSLLFSERNHFCPFCQVSGSAATSACELQRSAYHEGMTHWPMQPQWSGFVVDTSHPYFILDNNRCILCRRCVRACAEMAGSFTLNVEERGAATVIVADTNVPLGKSSCVQCGSCVQVCPTGALIDRQSAYLGADPQLEVTRSICTGCSVGCGIRIFTRSGHIVRIEGDWDGPVNGGVLCKRGRFLPLAEKRERLGSPLLKVNGVLVPVSWERALQAVAARIQAAPEQVAAVISPRLPVETLHAFRSLFGSELKSQTVACLGGQPAAHSRREGTLDDLQHSDCILVVGADLSNNHEVAGFMIKRNLPRGVKLILIAPQENDLADQAHFVLRPGTGSVEDVLNALSAAILQGELNRNPAEPLDAEGTLLRLLRQTGMPGDELIAAAETLARAAAPFILFESELYESSETRESLAKLAVLIGAVDDERCGLLSLKGAANNLAAAWLELNNQVALRDEQVVYLALGDDRLSEAQARRMQRAPFLVVQAAYASSLLDQADVVLPTTPCWEQGGHYVNLEGRLQQAQPALPAKAEAHDNTAVLVDLAGCLKIHLDTNWQEALNALNHSAPLIVQEA